MKSKNRPSLFRPAGCCIAVLVSIPTMVTSTAAADASAPPSAASEELQEVVVTAVGRPVNRLDSSISTSSVDVESVFQVAPRSTEELFRSLPGIRSESSGGEGNANITVRGIPLATGGSKYLQIMEDGLPVLEYGDLNFANVDNFVRYDWSLQRIESVRGGSASTFASDSPGGIINFIIRDHRVGFEINPEAAGRAGLRISSKLLQLASIVRDEARTEDAR